MLKDKGYVYGNNAYGTLISVESNGKEYPVICGHGGSMWLCRNCKEQILREEKSK